MAANDDDNIEIHAVVSSDDIDSTGIVATSDVEGSVLEDDSFGDIQFNMDALTYFPGVRCSKCYTTGNSQTALGLR